MQHINIESLEGYSLNLNALDYEPSFIDFLGVIFWSPKYGIFGNIVLNIFITLILIGFTYLCYLAWREILKETK